MSYAWNHKHFIEPVNMKHKCVYVYRINKYPCLGHVFIKYKIDSIEVIYAFCVEVVRPGGNRTRCILVDVKA